MKAIKTTYVSATNTKPSRIRASAEGVSSKLYSVDELSYETGSDNADKWHGLAAEKFRDANDWKLPLASGQIGPDVHVHCFVKRESPNLLTGTPLVVAQAHAFVAESYPTQPGLADGTRKCSAYHFELLKNALAQLDA